MNNCLVEDTLRPWLVHNLSLACIRFRLSTFMVSLFTNTWSIFFISNQLPIIFIQMEKVIDRIVNAQAQCVSFAMVIQEEIVGFLIQPSFLDFVNLTCCLVDTFEQLDVIFLNYERFGQATITCSVVLDILFCPQCPVYRELSRNNTFDNTFSLG